MSHTRKPVRNRDRETDCTPYCASLVHAAVVLGSVALGNHRLVQHCASLCSNYCRITDNSGRSPLHVAASRGHTHIVEWLVARKRVAVDTVDGESGWSALHRSVYFGELGTAVTLVKLGAGMGVKDHDSLTPLSLLNKDRLNIRNKPEVIGTDVHTWGSNANTTLGHAHSRPHPERLDLPSHLSITHVVLEKFHSVLLTSSGLVLTCGHGMGGRLGQGTEASFVTPRVVEALKGERCVGVAAARNHTLFLTDSGVAYSCGLNDAHQLGLGSAPNSTPKQCLTPTPITAKILRGRQIKGIGAGRYHSALATDCHVYTFGQNLGQLGYENNYPTQVVPKTVPQICVEGDDVIVSLSASHAATAVLTKRHRIFVCCDFTVKSLRCGFLEKLECRVFQVCASLTDRAHLRGTSPEPTKVLLLDSEHKLWYWEPGKRGMVPHLLPGLAQFNVVHFTLGKNLTIVTDEGEAYLSQAQSGQPLSFSRLSSVQNASAVFTDFKATNSAYLQTINSVLDLPSVTPPTLTSDLCGLLKDDNLLDSVADVELQAGENTIFSHRFILSRLSSHPITSPTLTLTPSHPHILDALLHYLYGATIKLVPILEKSDSGTTLAPPTSSPHAELTPDTSFASVDENDLTELYDRFSSQSPPPLTNHEISQQNGFDEVEINLSDRFLHQSTPRKGGRRRRGRSEGVEMGGCEVVEVRCVSVRKDLQTLLKLATELQVPSLIHSLDEILSNFSLKHATHEVLLSPPALSLSPSLSPTLTDVTLLTTDHQTLHCHKCVLVARSDYFKSMLLMGWRETSDGSTSLSLPFPSNLLSTVVAFIYTDNAPSVTSSNSLEWIVQVLVTADQLLLTRLRDICELTLAKKLTLRSVCEIAEVASACSAPQLKTACLQFISANAAALLEARLLDSLDPPLLPELSSVYKQMVPQLAKRTIRFPDLDPSKLPESYFMEGEGEGEEEEEEGDSAAAERQSDLRSPPPETPASQSGRRRRRDGRRRKSSQSEARKSRDSGCFRSPSPTSPTLTTSPLTPSPLPPSHSTSSQEDNNADSATSPQVCSNKNTPVETGSKLVSETGQTTPKSCSVGSNQRESIRSSTQKPRKKLLNSYKDTEEGEKEGGGKEGEFVRMTNGVPCPARKVWGGGESQAVSLKDIMAEEKQKELAVHTHQTHHSPPPHPHTSPRPLPASRQGSCDSAQSPPTNPWHAAQTAPAVSLRDLMAEETLRAERTRKKQPRSSLPSLSSHPHHPHTGHPSQSSTRRPSVPQMASPPVSFADIILSQQRELDSHCSQARKPLSCIQIEQKAINQLEALYGCHDNPDEYITVRRHTSRPSHTPSHHHRTPRSHTHAPPTSPWHSL